MDCTILQRHCLQNVIDLFFDLVLYRIWQIAKQCLHGLRRFIPADEPDDSVMESQAGLRCDLLNAIGCPTDYFGILAPGLLSQSGQSPIAEAFEPTTSLLTRLRI